MNNGKQIIRLWAKECLHKRDDSKLPLDDGHYAGILTPEWQALVDRVDIALREARQEGLDFRKQKKMFSEESEFGPFWQQFYLNGGLEKPGLAEAFDCTKDDPMWLNQWNEVIRIKLKKPVLRAVDPATDFLDYLRFYPGMTNEDCKALILFVQSIIQYLSCQDEVQAEQPRWSIAALKGK